MIQLFSFKGRASRLGFWRVQLLLVALSAVDLALGYFAVIAAGPVGGILFVPFLPFLVIGVATCLRRLHDRGKNVWWLLLFNLCPPVCIGIAQTLVAKGSVALSAASLPFSLAGLAIWVWGWIEIGLRRGEPQNNRFGEAPKLVRS